MKYVKPLSIAVALALGLISMDAVAATSAIDINTNPTQQMQEQATYYVADAGTLQAHKVYYFDKLDRDHDGQLSRSEVPKDMRYLRLHFIEVDWNENGKLSPEEYVLYEHHQAPRYAGVYHAMVFFRSY